MCIEASRGHQESITQRQVLSLNLQLDWQPASLSNPPEPALGSVSVKGAWRHAKLFTDIGIWTEVLMLGIKCSHSLRHFCSYQRVILFKVRRKSSYHTQSYEISNLVPVDCWVLKFLERSLDYSVAVGSLCWEGRCSPAVHLTDRQQEGEKSEMSLLWLSPLSDGSAGEASFEAQSFPQGIDRVKRKETHFQASLSNCTWP